MANHELRTKRASDELWVERPFHHKRPSKLAGESDILEAIVLGVPVPTVLNKLCTAVDFQIGNVVSLVLLPDGVENHYCSVTHIALQVGLQLFSSTDILSRDKTLLGTLEIYGCNPRRPTQREHRLIERAVHLAAIALQRDVAEEDPERPLGRSRNRIDGALERPSFVN
jgi:hypothetical protein